MHLIPFVSGIGENVSWPLTLLKAPAGLAGAVPCHGPAWQRLADGCLEGIVSCEEGGG